MATSSHLRSQSPKAATFIYPEVYSLHPSLQIRDLTTANWRMRLRSGCNLDIHGEVTNDSDNLSGLCSTYDDSHRREG